MQKLNHKGSTRLWEVNWTNCIPCCSKQSDFDNIYDYICIRLNKQQSAQ